MSYIEKIFRKFVGLKSPNYHCLAQEKIGMTQYTSYVEFISEKSYPFIDFKIIARNLLQKRSSSFGFQVTNLHFLIESLGKANAQCRKLNGLSYDEFNSDKESIFFTLVTRLLGAGKSKRILEFNNEISRDKLFIIRYHISKNSKRLSFCYYKTGGLYNLEYMPMETLPNFLDHLKICERR